MATTVPSGTISDYYENPEKYNYQMPTQADTTTGRSSTWSDVIAGIGGAIGGYVKGSQTNAANRTNQTQLRPGTSPNWLPLGLVALGVVLLVLVMRK